MFERDATALPQQIPPIGPDTPAPKKPRRLRARGQRGSIFRRGPSWVIVYRHERKQKTETHQTKDAAQARLTEIIKAIREKKHIDLKRSLFSVYVDSWLDRQQSNLKPGTWRSYRSAISKWIKPAFPDDYKMSDISRSMVKLFIERLTDEGALTGKSVKGCLRLLHVIFEHAMDEEFCATNPAHKLKVKFRNDSVPRVVPTKAEILATLAELGETPTLQAMLATAALTGMRRGELCALRWTNIHFHKRMIEVDRSLVRLHEDRAGKFTNVERIAGSKAFVLARPKSEKSKREVVMSPPLVKLLKELRAISDASNLFVFPDAAGGPLDFDAIAPILHAAQARAKVKRFGLHGCRHFFASAMHDKGATMAQMQAQLGHADMQTTAKYTHVLELDRKHVEKVGRGFSSVIGLLAEGSPHQERKESAR